MNNVAPRMDLLRILRSFISLLFLVSSCRHIFVVMFIPMLLPLNAFAVFLLWLTTKAFLEASNPVITVN